MAPVRREPDRRLSREWLKQPSFWSWVVGLAVGLAIAFLTSLDTYLTIPIGIAAGWGVDLLFRLFRAGKLVHLDEQGRGRSRED